MPEWIACGTARGLNRSWLELAKDSLALACELMSVSPVRLARDLPIRLSICIALGMSMSLPAEAATRTFEEFLRALGERESAGDYRAVNTLGHLGAYQFGELALVDLGYYTLDGSVENDWTGDWTGKDGILGKSDFLENPAVQDQAMKAWTNRLWDYAVDPEFALAKYAGQTVGGIPISPAGIVAGAHLVGIWGVASFLRSNGADDPLDPFGVHVSDYVRLFSDYETPFGPSQ
jgi:serralysin